MFDIQKCSIQFLKNIFSSLDQHVNYVFWIRNHDMSRQIYVNVNYEKIWKQGAGILFEVPLIWFDYLSMENKTSYMKQLQDRHVHNYFDQQLNLVLYQVSTPNNEKVYLQDKCFKCQDSNNQQYVVGISKTIPTASWDHQYQVRLENVDDHDQEIYKEFFSILKHSFGITLALKPNEKISALTEYHEYLTDNPSSVLSKREQECLFYFCQGKTYKQTGREMSISHRTVETHLENILRKTSCGNKMELVGRFSKHFIDFRIPDKK